MLLAEQLERADERRDAPARVGRRSGPSLRIDQARGRNEEDLVVAGTGTLGTGHLAHTRRHKVEGRVLGSRGGREVGLGRGQARMIEAGVRQIRLLGRRLRICD